MKAGVCRNSLMPLRSEPSHQSEMISQLLFGEHYKVIEISQDKEWVRVQNYYDDYRGWIAFNQYHEISEEYYEQINQSDFKICTELTSTILLGKAPSTICIGSIIPIATNELFEMEEKLAFNGEAKSLSQKRDAEFLKNVAKKYLNTPYLWGGKSPFGIDCSGFTQMVFKICGYKIPRDSRQQIKEGKEVKFNDARTGDLVFFHNSKGKMDHVGIFLDDYKVIHASGKVRIDKLTKKGIVHSTKGEMTHWQPLVRRVW